ncbi:hypothetical protein [Riemerella columbina]|uniref:hypothetical protein n=1 Tax=Riemerella columbina TaxID=103810 RepID=UPI00266F6F82|nr:hypothetical protein [Riemerella columbina]WKS95242.1 hypothetical protein NYR17_00445 [Riemerella columbina]
MNVKIKLNRKLNISPILEAAIGYWKKTIGFQILFSVLYFGLLMVFATGLLQYLNLEPEIAKFQKIIADGQLKNLNKAAEELSKNEAMSYFILGLSIIKALLFPLNIGFYQIYQKIDLQEPYKTSDLLAGYRGGTFFKFFGYALFWGIILSYLQIIPLFLPLLWMMLTLLVTPIMYFLNLNIFESIRLNWVALRLHFVSLLMACFACVLFSYSGLLLFGIGYLVTFPFWNAMLYTLYKRLFIITKN